MLISPTRFPWSKEGSNGERKEGSKMEEAGEGGRELLRPVWKKKQWWSEKPPLSLSIRRSPFIERGNNRTTRNLEARINEESHSPPLREAQPSQSRSGGQSGFPSREAPPAAHAKKRTSPAVVATDDDAAAAADNNNAWETAECEKNAQGVTLFRRVHLGCIDVSHL